MSTKKFPVRIVRGSVAVKIYRQRSARGHESFAVCYYHDRDRKRRSFSDFEAARQEAQLMAMKLAEGDMDALTLRWDDRLSYVRSMELLRPLGVSLEKATGEYAQAVHLLSGDSLLEAVSFYRKHNPKMLPKKTVAEVVDELLMMGSHARAISICSRILFSSMISRFHMITDYCPHFAQR